jgi:hypothetical protein
MAMGVFWFPKCPMRFYVLQLCSLNTLEKFQVFTNTGTSDEVADYVIFLDHILRCNLHVL